jgi:nanoRNase/pAp phosphatase (c-di-AMP/oligoRNAs hydrolase)
MTKLDELIECIERPHVYILTHNYPDQDALASALGLQVLFQARGKYATIIYHGIIDKVNTLKMLELLSIEIYPLQDVSLAPEDEIIIVDGQNGNINMADTNGQVIACIDHHQIQNTACYRFYDIRSNVGACSSIITSYFLENNIPITSDLATALLYGIKIDTANMTRGVNLLDITVFSHLYYCSNKKKLKSLEKSSIQLSDLVSYKKAIDSLKTYGPLAIANIGNDCSEAMIATVSDFLLTISEIEFSLVYSYRGGGIKFSVRSALPFVDASDFIKTILAGYGDGGGHSNMSAGFVPNISTEEKATQLVALIISRTFSYINQFTPSYDNAHSKINL